MTTTPSPVVQDPSKRLRILVYKRTHVGDPDVAGRFGINHCMGSVRAYEYDAVIGVGGMGSEPQSHGIDGRITWIGIGPRKDWDSSTDPRGPLVTFEKFCLWDSAGPPLLDHAPMLARRMYEKKARVVVDLTSEEQAEAESILGFFDTIAVSTTQSGPLRAASAGFGKPGQLTGTVVLSESTPKKASGCASEGNRRGKLPPARGRGC